MSAARAAAWGLVVLSVGVAHQVTSAQPAGLRMLVLIGALFFAMKALVSVESRARYGTRLSPLRWAAFATLWPGMRPALVARLRPGRSGSAALLKAGFAYVGLGATLFLLAHLTWRRTGSTVLSTVILLPALSFLLHFGPSASWRGWRAAGGRGAALPRAMAQRASAVLVAALEPGFLGDDGACDLPAGRRSRGPEAALAAAFFSRPHEVAISLPCAPDTAGPCSTSRSTR